MKYRLEALTLKASIVPRVRSRKRKIDTDAASSAAGRSSSSDMLRFEVLFSCQSDLRGNARSWLTPALQNRSQHVLMSDINSSYAFPLGPNASFAASDSAAAAGTAHAGSGSPPLAAGVGVAAALANAPTETRGSLHSPPHSAPSAPSAPSAASVGPSSPKSASVAAVAELTSPAGAGAYASAVRGGTVSTPASAVCGVSTPVSTPTALRSTFPQLPVAAASSTASASASASAPASVAAAVPTLADGSSTRSGRDCDLQPEHAHGDGESESDSGDLPQTSVSDRDAVLEMRYCRCSHNQDILPSQPDLVALPVSASGTPMEEALVGTKQLVEALGGTSGLHVLGCHESETSVEHSYGSESYSARMHFIDKRFWFTVPFSMHASA